METNVNSKLTGEQVVRIKRLINDDILSYAKIGRMFNVTRHCIRDIAIGVTHKNIKLEELAYAK